MKLFKHSPDVDESMDPRKFEKTIKGMLLAKAYYSVGEFLDDN